jgi:hypothetical protein
MLWFLFILGSLATFRLSICLQRSVVRLLFMSVFAMQCQVGAAQLRNGSVVSSAFLSLQARWFARFFGWEEQSQLGGMDLDLARV